MNNRLAGPFALVVACAIAGGAPRAEAQGRSTGVIVGVVTDTGLRAVESAEVLLFGTTIRLPTDKSGRFLFTGVPPKQYMITVRRLGFVPISGFIEVNAGDTLRLSYELVPAASALSAVTVTGQSRSLKLQEFEDRMKGGTGEYYTTEDIEKRAMIRVADVLRQSKIVQLVPAPGNQLFAMSKRPAIGMSGECPMQVFVDGAPYIGGTGVQSSAPPATSSGGLGALPGVPPAALNNPPDLNTLLSTNEIAGMEVYAGAATTPVKYNTGANRWCGAILIWTKDR